MELQEYCPNSFVNNWLPNIKKVWENYMSDKCEDKCFYSDREILDDYFISEYFPEALQNFADRICEKQRKLCFEETKQAIKDLDFQYFEESIYRGTIEAEQPKIKLLTPDE